MARNIECRCTDRFTCGYCLRNKKPYFFTLSSGAAVYEIPVQRSTTEAAQEEPTEEQDARRLRRALHS